MLKLTFTYKGVQWQLEGEDRQITSFLSSFPQETMELSNPKPMLIGRKPHSKAKVSQETTEQIEMLDEPLHSAEEVKKYLLSQPNFSHDLFKVQEHFYGRRFSSRGEEQRMYYRTLKQLRVVRAAIAQELHGKFKEIKGEIRGQKRYVFESMQTVTLAS